MPAKAKRRPGRPTKTEALDTEKQVWLAVQAGQTVEQVAEDLSLEAKSVAKYLRRACGRALANPARTVELIRAAQDSRLSYLYGECMEGWKASKGPRRVVKETTRGEGPDKEKTTVMEAHERLGDLDYIREALGILEQQRRLHGMDAKPAGPPSASDAAPQVMQIVVEVTPDADGRDEQGGRGESPAEIPPRPGEGVEQHGA